MVDAVFTWVDGNDPTHLQKRLKYQGMAEFTADVIEEATSKTRFADEGELWYSINLLRKNAAWIDRIFLVTDQQKPDWLCDKTQKELNITLVDHKEIFKGYEHFLPTFNSQTIELMLTRITGLNNQFLYLNDDFFIIRNIKYSDFFSRKKIKFRGKWKMRGTSLLGRFERLLCKEPPGFIGFNVDRRDLPFSLRRFNLGHAPFPIIADEMENIFENTNLIKRNVHFKFRNIMQPAPLTVFSSIAFNKGIAQRGPNDWGYLRPAKDPVEFIERRLSEFEKNDRFKTVCIQSLDLASPLVKTKVVRFLDHMLSQEQCMKNSSRMDHVKIF